MNSKSAGYSLLEVLVAFGVMMLVLSALLPGQSRLAASSIRLQERQQANEYALSLLALASRETGLVSGTETGVYQSRWVWQIEVSTHPATSAKRPLYFVSVEVANTGGDILSSIDAVRSGNP